MRTFDFERARITWLTPTGSHGIWRVVAVATSFPSSGSPLSTALAPAVMAGDVYAQGRLPLSPAYSFQLLASAQRHVILRDYGAALRETTADNNEIFADLTLHLPTVEARTIIPDRYVKSGIPWPLTAEIALTDINGLAWRLTFPVNHFNHRSGRWDMRLKTEGDEFQVETGPILVPGEALVTDATVLYGGFVLAYAFFNRLDCVDLALLVSSQHTRDRTYSGYATLRDASVTLFTI
jgi:hypothetical protein